MTGIEKSVFGSFFRICEFDSSTFRSLNESEPYLRREDGKWKDVDIVKIIPCGSTEKGNTLFCYELLWR